MTNYTHNFENPDLQPYADGECRHERSFTSKGATAEMPQAAKIANDAEPVTFDELFNEFDTWHFDRFRNHAERMQVEVFFEFLQYKKVVKETV